MRIILLGPPGSGKGTQAQFIMKKYGFPQINASNVLRQQIYKNTTLGNQIKSFMNIGKLVPDNIIISLIIDYIKKNNYKKKFVLDGFPRNTNQANAIKKNKIIIDCILEFIVPDDIIIERIIGRRIHKSSGRIYHVIFNPPKQEGIDDLTGESLIIRDDDKLSIVKDRLSVYHKEKESLMNFYNQNNFLNKIKIYQIDGIVSPEQVSKTLSKIIDNFKIN